MVLCVQLDVGRGGGEDHTGAAGQQAEHVHVHEAPGREPAAGRGRPLAALYHRQTLDRGCLVARAVRRLDRQLQRTLRSVEGAVL